MARVRTPCSQAIAAAVCLLIAAPSHPTPTGAAATQAATVGKVAFANSGKPAAQEPFLRGLALLHNFEYARARQAFQEAQRADPGFAMAFWGEAMTHNHPVWMEQDRDAGEAVLARLGADKEARLAKAPTARERGYLEAMELLYGSGTKAERDRLYSDHMAALSAAHANDIDARAFHALSLLGLAHDGRDHGLYMRSAALLEEIYPANPEHPGVLHYLIHSYDDPVHAPLGLRAARAYGRVAPDAGHALHMTSHIFLALGMWPEVEQANIEAMTVVNAERRAAGRPDVHCGHYPDWLAYARMQQGKDIAGDLMACTSDAKAELASPASGPLEPYRSMVLAWAEMALRHGIETGAWDFERPALPEDGYLTSRFVLGYADLLAAGRDTARVKAARVQLEELAAKLGAEQARLRPDDVHAPRWQKVVLMQARGLEQLATGDAAGGIATLRAAAEAEAAIPAGFGPPMIEKPSHELLGDALAHLGRHQDAAAAYRSSLQLAPNRRLSMRGFALAETNGAGNATAASIAAPAHAGH